MREKQITVNSSGKNLYGMAHYPGETPGKFPGVLFFHGLTGTSIEPHRIFVKTARKLAEQGMASVRFDFSGAGQSEGESHDTGFYDWVRDAKNILDYIEKDDEIEANNLSAVSLSMGSAVLMYLLGKKIIRTKKNVFLSPAITLKELTASLKENNMKEGGYIIFNGNRISRKSMEEAGEIDLFSMDYKETGPSLIMHSRDDNTVDFRASEILNKFLRQNGAETGLVLLDKGGHTFEVPSSEDTVIEKISKWLPGD